MREYVATFHTHLSALMTSRNLTGIGLQARMMPVFRKLSSSCGTCVVFTAEGPCLEQMDVFDCIYLAMELQYLDVAETLIEEWKSGVVDWTDAERKKMIQFYDYLGKNNENAIQYKALLDTAITSGKCFDIVSAYNDIINCYIKEKQYELGYSYLKEMIATVDFKEILQIRLFASVLEESFENICALDTPQFDLWKWAKKYLLNMEKQKMFGNLYKKAIAAAKRCRDPIATELENEGLCEFE